MRRLLCKHSVRYFNPHSPFRASATWDYSPYSIISRMFQSSLSLPSECYSMSIICAPRRSRASHEREPPCTLLSREFHSLLIIAPSLLLPRPPCALRDPHCSMSQHTCPAQSTLLPPVVPPLFSFFPPILVSAAKLVFPTSRT